MSKVNDRVATATHRPAVRRRRFRHDDLVAVDLFSGFGGLTKGIKAAGFTTIMAANHKEYKVQVHEANHPEAEHWIADLVDPDKADYHDVRDLPAGDLLVAGVSCVNHSKANTIKAYEQGLTLFGMEDEEYEARVTRSERDRATANCVLHYAAVHHPRLILVECTTELASWGPALPGRSKVGDGSTYRWWLKQFGILGYKHKVLYLNSMFFDVPQSRNRGFWAFWDKNLPDPDLDHRPVARCLNCDRDVEAVWTWRTGVPPTGTVSYGIQYDYRCPSCRREVVPPMTPSLFALDLSDLGTRIGDKPIKEFTDKKTGEISRGPLAPATMARAERCRRRFGDFPAVLMPAKAVHGSERHLLQPMATQTSQQETAIISTGAVIAAHRHNGDGKNFAQPMDTATSTHEKAILTTGALMAAAGNTFERPGSDCRTRSLDEPLWAQTATNTTGLIAPPIALAVANYQGAPRGAGEPLPTQAGSETLGLLTSGVLPYRQNTLATGPTEAMPTVTAEQIPGLLFSGWYKQNGSTGAETAPHPMSDALGTLTARDTTALLMAEWRAALAELSLDDCYFRMMAAHEIGRGCGFDTDFPGHKGKFVVWGSARDQTDGFGNAVSPQVGAWIGARLRAIIHGPEAAL
jgi:site-specific DNA-cytosine methylase